MEILIGFLVCICEPMPYWGTWKHCSYTGKNKWTKMYLLNINLTAPNANHCRYVYISSVKTYLWKRFSSNMLNTRSKVVLKRKVVNTFLYYCIKKCASVPLVYFLDVNGHISFSKKVFFSKGILEKEWLITLLFLPVVAMSNFKSVKRRLNLICSFVWNFKPVERTKCF